MPSLKKRQKLINEIIDELGGTNQVAKITKVVPSAVSNWRRIGRFPARTYLQITAEVKRCEMPTYLWGMGDQ